MIKKEFYYYASVWGITLPDAEKLQRIARSLETLAAAASNAPGLSDRQKARKETLKAEARKICDQYDLHVAFQLDPRGRPIHIYHTPREARNDDRNSPYLTP